MNRIGFISVNHFWTLTHEVGFHLHSTQTALTNMSLQTDLTRRNISRRKEKEKEKRGERKSQKVFLVEEADRVDMKWRSGDRDLFMLCKLTST